MFLFCQNKFKLFSVYNSGRPAKIPLQARSSDWLKQTLSRVNASCHDHSFIHQTNICWNLDSAQGTCFIAEEMSRWGLSGDLMLLLFPHHLFLIYQTFYLEIMVCLYAVVRNNAEISCSLSSFPLVVNLAKPSALSHYLCVCVCVWFYAVLSHMQSHADTTTAKTENRSITRVPTAPFL